MRLVKIGDMIISYFKHGVVRWLVSVFRFGQRQRGSNTGQTVLRLLACCQTLQVYQATYVSYFRNLLVLSLDEKLVIRMTVHATVSHIKTQ